MPPFINERYHPEPTWLKLNWSHLGEWVKIPVSNKDKGPEYRDARLGRIKVYVDIEGRIRRALSYGEEAETLETWFNLEDVKDAFPHWVIPKPCPYYNTRRFNPASIRKELLNNKNVVRPGDQSGRDIQGKRVQQPTRGRNRTRGYGSYQDRDRDAAYKEWDRQ